MQTYFYLLKDVREKRNFLFQKKYMVTFEN